MTSPTPHPKPRLRVLVLPGDGIGPEVTDAAIRVLRALVPEVELTYRDVGLAALASHGIPFEADLLEVAREHDAIVLGAAGGIQDPSTPRELRPEAALFALRSGLDLFTNLRPVTAFDALISSLPLKEDAVRGTDFLLVRELTGGLYFGKKELGETSAYDTCEYSVDQIRRILEVAFVHARARRGRLASVDKANVLNTGALWRRLATELAEANPEVEVEHLLVDNAAMQLLLRPQSFDVVVTENLFGDILSDEVSLISGGLGMMPSASLGTDGPVLYEPAHGSAPDIAGRGIANPCAAILSIAMLLRHTAGSEAAASAVEAAVAAALAAGHRTRDLGGSATTAEVTEAVLSRLDPRP
ncbi:MAG: 3-isopropylmalate dehydrogenase [Gaiellales bacterium]